MYSVEKPRLSKEVKKGKTERTSWLVVREGVAKNVGQMLTLTFKALGGGRNATNLGQYPLNEDNCEALELWQILTYKMKNKNNMCFPSW